MAEWDIADYLGKYILKLSAIDNSGFSEDVEIMRIDFNDIDSMTFPGMNNGTGNAPPLIFYQSFRYFSIMHLNRSPVEGGV